jgi:hypothetical protein
MPTFRPQQLSLSVIAELEEFPLTAEWIVARLVIAASRIRLWLVSGWGCRGRRLSSTRTEVNWRASSLGCIEQTPGRFDSGWSRRQLFPNRVLSELPPVNVGRIELPNRDAVQVSMHGSSYKGINRGVLCGTGFVFFDNLRPGQAGRL